MNFGAGMRMHHSRVQRYQMHDGLPRLLVSHGNRGGAGRHG